MDIKTIKDRNDNDYIIIENDDGSETSMPKSVYDAQLAAQKEGN